VKINASSLKDREQADALVAEANELARQACECEQTILQIVEGKL
jgi:glutamate formiminotransferase/formiminotetrahydrofolate cyclodeaminase